MKPFRASEGISITSMTNVNVVLKLILRCLIHMSEQNCELDGKLEEIRCGVIDVEDSLNR